MWINSFTGELYNNLYHALKTIISDMIIFPKCRTLEMFNIRPYKH